MSRPHREILEVRNRRFFPFSNNEIDLIQQGLIIIDRLAKEHLSERTAERPGLSDERILKELLNELELELRNRF